MWVLNSSPGLLEEQRVLLTGAAPHLCKPANLHPESLSGIQTLFTGFTSQSSATVCMAMITPLERCGALRISHLSSVLAFHQPGKLLVTEV